MIAATVTVTGNLQGIPTEEQVKEAAARALVPSLEHVQQQAKENIEQQFTRRNDPSFADSVVTQVDAENLSGVVGSPAPQARIDEYGGTILPVNGQWLVFQTPDGQWHKVASVTMPARPWLNPALQESKPFIEQAFMTELSPLGIGVSI